MSWDVIFLRLSVIFIISGVIGYDREYKNRPAGTRTHILVGLGAGIIALVQVESNALLVKQALENPELISMMNIDSGRLIAQVVSGVGFLGAGTIIVTKGQVKGLTTAASLWTTASIGIAVGLGFLKLGFISFLLVLAALIIVTKFLRLNNLKKVEIVYKDFDKTHKLIENIFKENKVKIENCQFKTDSSNERNYIVIYTLVIPPSISLDSISYKLREQAEIIKVSGHKS